MPSVFQRLQKLEQFVGGRRDLAADADYIGLDELRNDVDGLLQCCREAQEQLREQLDYIEQLQNCDKEQKKELRRLSSDVKQLSDSAQELERCCSDKSRDIGYLLRCCNNLKRRQL